MENKEQVIEEPKEKKILNFDNPDLAMMCCTIIAIFSLFIIPDPSTIIVSIVTGIMGLAVSKKKE